MASQIRWKRGDYVRLGRAVADFNRKVEAAEVEGSDLIPLMKNYEALKDQIVSRKELNRIVKSLKRATNDNLTEVYEFPSGEVVTQWERKEIQYAKRRALINLDRERQTLLQENESIGMGYERLSEINAIEKSFNTLGTRTGMDFKRVLKRILSIGRSDYKLSKDIQFRENFYKALEDISNFSNYGSLIKQLNKIKNPSKFVEYVKKSPVLMDIFLWYKDSDVTVYGGFSNNEEAFDSTLMFHLGIDLNE